MRASSPQFVTARSLAFALLLLVGGCGTDNGASSATDPPFDTPRPTILTPSAAPTISASPAQSSTPSSSPSPTPTLTPLATRTIAPEAARRQLAYVGSDGGIWLVHANGSGLVELVSEPCGVGYREPTFLSWAPTGDKLAVWCSVPGEDRSSVSVLDTSGNIITTIPSADGFQWAPSGEKIAYQLGLRLGSLEDAEVRVLNLSTLEDRTIAADAYLLDWPQPDRLLLGFNLVPDDPYIVAAFEANWYEPASGRRERIARLDSNVSFWITPDGTKAVLLSGLSSYTQEGFELAIYDFQKGDEQAIAGSAISYPAESIPPSRLAISSDSKRIYWANFDLEAGEPLYRANVDGSELTNLGRVPGIAVAISGEGLVVYIPLSSEENRRKCVIQDLESGASVEIESCTAPVWDPHSEPPGPYQGDK